MATHNEPLHTAVNRHLPQELIDMITRLVFQHEPEFVVSIEAGYVPPSIHQVNRACRETFAPVYYRHSTFKVADMKTCIRWLASLHEDRLRRIWHVHLGSLPDVRAACPKGLPQRGIQIKMLRQWLELQSCCRLLHEMFKPASLPIQTRALQNCICTPAYMGPGPFVIWKSDLFHTFSRAQFVYLVKMEDVFFKRAREIHLENMSQLDLVIDQYQQVIDDMCKEEIKVSEADLKDHAWRWPTARLRSGSIPSIGMNASALSSGPQESTHLCCS